MRDFYIDNATLADIPNLVILLNELFSIEKDFTPDAEKQFRGLKMLIQKPAMGVIKVARDSQSKAIGMVSAQLVISTVQGAPSAWVEDMIISQPYRASGIGKKLLAEALAWAKSQGATRAQLLVDIENPPALGYYAHLGWKSTQLQARNIFL